MINKIKVAVLLGGDSSEREVSLSSGGAVLKALEGNEKFEITTFDPASDMQEFAKKASNGEVDVAFLALHGTGYEDGKIQGFLDTIGVPYTGAGVAGSSIGFDKISTKRVLRSENLPLADDIIIEKSLKGWRFSAHQDNKTLQNGLLPEQDLVEEVKQIVAKMGYPVFIKPSQEGSSVNIFKIDDEADLEEKLVKLLGLYERILIEKGLTGMEATVSVFQDLEPTITEIISNKGSFYNYESKYADGGSTHVLPARISEGVAAKIGATARKLGDYLGIFSYYRMDVFVDGDKFWITEVNTLPGMTATSLLPEAVNHCGVAFPEMCERMILGELE